MNKSLLSIQSKACFDNLKKYLNKSKWIYILSPQKFEGTAVTYCAMGGKVLGIYNEPNIICEKEIIRYVVNFMFSKAKHKRYITIGFNDLKNCYVENVPPMKAGIFLANYINGKYEEWLSE